MVSYKKLDLERGEIRLLTLHPGEFDDPIRISLRHAILPIPDEPLAEPQVNLEDIQKTLPPGWEVHKTFEGRVIFWNPAEQKSSWSHPDPAVPYVSEIPRQPRKLAPSQPEFEALSYTWGSAGLGSGEHVRIEQSDDFPHRAPDDPDMILSVTDNLAAALRHLRSPTDPRTLWIDALCINQADVVERGRHVARMGSVYALATRVVAWLGPEADDSTRALETLEHLGKQIEMKGTGEILSPICDRPEWVHKFPCDDATLRALRALLHRRWFQRLWVWQEIVLANLDAHVQCGRKTVSWYFLRRGLVILRETDLPRAEMRAGLMPNPLCWLPYIFEADYRVWHGVSKLLHSAGQTGCVDPRDRIYALLGMCEPRLAARVRVDYTLPHAQVYADFFKLFVESYQSLLLLQYCDLERRGFADAPTWVPDWDNTVVRPWQLVYAAGLSRAQVAFDPESGAMTALGVRAAKVAAVSEKKWLDSPDSVVQVFEMMKDWYRIWRQHCSEDAPLEEFITPLVYGWTSERRHVGISVAAHVADWLDLTGGDEEPSADKLGRSVLLQSIIRDERTCAFFCTDKGQCGLGSVGTKTGDTVSVILGSDYVMILRPQGGQTEVGEKFQVVGPAYVHGIMDAQCLLGEFQHPHGLKIDCGTPKGNVWTTLNTETGKSDAEDARLGPLPSGWSVLEDGRFSDGQGVVTQHDPRWSVESLRERGVKLEEFCIV
ncbi:hypothetical protein NEMBOFW57_001034 [Staphylotrichum longicolle]|uniref:WW domain-containing protein n=1 Tax=Staphylotrichum longicolle TaxID=669026 RepID=A0AAD4F0F0_9PEZI|nr:hypothetical protein NEMBOFW57_001034 [Staphylotrichum longicolle]